MKMNSIVFGIRAHDRGWHLIRQQQPPDDDDENTTKPAPLDVSIKRRKEKIFLLINSMLCDIHFFARFVFSFCAFASFSDAFSIHFASSLSRACENLFCEALRALHLFEFIRDDRMS